MQKILIIIGPSAIGKSFTASSLINSFPQHFTRVKPYTTRKKRSSEGSESDRIFISKEEFEQMAQRGDFSVDEHFAGNRYGYRKVDLEPTGRHLIVNAPPYWLPQFLHYKNLVVVGLQASPEYWSLLDERMAARGDSPQNRNARKPYIEKDIRDLQELLPIISERGKLFQIEDDQTVPTKVIPWITETLII